MDALVPPSRGTHIGALSRIRTPQLDVREDLGLGLRVFPVDRLL